MVMASFLYIIILLKLSALGTEKEKRDEKKFSPHNQKSSRMDSYQGVMKFFTHCNYTYAQEQRRTLLRINIFSFLTKMATS